jgi:hypothetical protein
MTWRLGIVLLSCLVVAVAASQAHAALTRNRLQSAMQHYALCRVHDKQARVAGGISAADHGRLTVELLMSNKAALIVNAGSGQRHRVRWITSHGVVQHLFTFRRLSQVAGKLDEACR